MKFSRRVTRVKQNVSKKSELGFTLELGNRKALPMNILGKNKYVSFVKTVCSWSSSASTTHTLFLRDVTEVWHNFHSELDDRVVLRNTQSLVLVACDS